MRIALISHPRALSATPAVCYFELKAERKNRLHDGRLRRWPPSSRASSIGCTSGTGAAEVSDEVSVAVTKKAEPE